MITLPAPNSRETMNRKPVLYRDAMTELNMEANTTDVPTGPGAPESCPGPVAAHSDLAQGDKDYLAVREKIVSLGIKATIATARALFEIYSFGEGRLWKAQHPTFEAYCRERWDLRKSQAYRLLECGKFIAGLEAGARDDDSPFGERLPQNEGQIRPLMSLPDEHRLECWNEIFAEAAPSSLTAKEVGEKVRHYAESRELPGFGSGRKEGKPAAAGEHLSKLREIAAEHANRVKIAALIDEIEALLG